MAKLTELRASQEGSSAASNATNEEIFTQVMGPKRLGQSSATSQETPYALSDEIRSLRAALNEQNMRLNIMERALNAMGITLDLRRMPDLPVTPTQPTYLESAHHVLAVNNHDDSHSEQEIGPSLQPQPHPFPETHGLTTFSSPNNLPYKAPIKKKRERTRLALVGTNTQAPIRKKRKRTHTCANRH